MNKNNEQLMGQQSIESTIVINKETTQNSTQDQKLFDEKVRETEEKKQLSGYSSQQIDTDLDEISRFSDDDMDFVIAVKNQHSEKFSDDEEEILQENIDLSILEAETTDEMNKLSDKAKYEIDKHTEKSVKAEKKQIVKLTDEEREKKIAEHDSLMQERKSFLDEATEKYSLSHTGAVEKASVEKAKKTTENLMAIIKEKYAEILKEKEFSSSELFTNVTKEYEKFEAIFSSGDVTTLKESGYMPQLMSFREAVIAYYRKNKGFKWTPKGRRRRDLAKNMLDLLDKYLVEAPCEIKSKFCVALSKNYENVNEPENQELLYRMGCNEVNVNESSERSRKKILPEAMLLAGLVKNTQIKRTYLLKKLTEEEYKLLDNGKERATMIRFYDVFTPMVECNMDGSSAESEEMTEQKIKKFKDILNDEKEDKKARAEFLERFKKAHLSIDMLKPKYYFEHFDEIYNNAFSLIQSENVFYKGGRLGNEFWESLSEDERKKVIEREKQYGDITTALYQSVLSTYGVNLEGNFKSDVMGCRNVNLKDVEDYIDYLIKNPVGLNLTIYDNSDLLDMPVAVTQKFTFKTIDDIEVPKPIKGRKIKENEEVFDGGYNMTIPVLGAVTNYYQKNQPTQ